MFWELNNPEDIPRIEAALKELTMTRDPHGHRRRHRDRRRDPFALITGPCQLESLDHARMMAERIAEACAPTGTRFIFKASYDKANRSSLGTARGLGHGQGAEILGEDPRRVRLPDPDRRPCRRPVRPRGARLRRDPDPRVPLPPDRPAAGRGRDGAAINVKKGQFLAPWDMGNVADKIASTGNDTDHALRPRHVLRLQHAGQRFPRPADHGAHGLSGGLRRDPFGAAARRAGRHHRAASASSRRSWPARPAPWASRRCSSRPTRIPTTPPPTGPT